MTATAAPQIPVAVDSSFVWGTWKTVSWTREIVATRERSDALGRNPWGWITYTPEGRMMVLLVRGDRTAPTQTPPADREKIALFDGMLAYAGTYVADRDKIVHRLEASWNQIWAGTEQIRFYRLEGKRLRLWTPVMKDPVSGQDSVHTVVFEKLESNRP